MEFNSGRNSPLPSGEGSGVRFFLQIITFSSLFGGFFCGFFWRCFIVLVFIVGVKDLDIFIK